jgi:ArsR family transcriptional regulator
MKTANVNLMFRAFSDRTRLRILHLLLGGELCVCDIVTVIKIAQPKASRHLSYLLRAGLIKKRKEGLWAYYQLAPASSPLHRSLFKCLEECFTEMPELAADARRAKRENVCCGVVSGGK